MRVRLKEARVQAPERMIQATTVQENDNRFCVIECLAARGCKNLLSVDVEIHAYDPAMRFAARKPFSKSAWMSATSSSPTDKRTISSVIPAAIRASASMRE